MPGRSAGHIVIGLAALSGAASLFMSGQGGRAAAAPTSQTVMTPAAPPVPMLIPTVVARHPHDPRAFTQGLIWRGDSLYESTGREGESEVRRVRLADGRVLARAALPANQFGEGLAAHRGELVSLTWRDGVAHRWNAATLTPRGISRYPGEGWGLAGDGREFVLSDGTPVLRFVDPVRFTERRRVTVTFRGRPLPDLNELEWVNGALYANVWRSPYLVRINPATGVVDAVVDLSPLVREVDAADPEAVANGIAWDPERRRLFVTGKLWPILFEVKLEPRR